MDVGYTAEQESLRTSVRGVLTDHAPLTALRARYGNAPTSLDDAWWKLEDLGVSEILTPADRGGLGLGMVDLGVVLEECGRALYDGPVVAGAVSAAYLVAALGDDSAAGRSGAALAVVALHERGRRFDWRTPSVTVTDGRVSGEKVHVPHATLADLFLVVAPSSPSSSPSPSPSPSGDLAAPSGDLAAPSGDLAAPSGEGLSVWSVAAGDDRVAVVPDELMDGSSPTASVSFDGVPAQQVGTGDATDAIAAMVDRTVLAHVVEGVGTAQRAFELTLAYAREREQFGKPIGSFQAVQGLCVEMLQTLELGRAAAHYALWALDHADAAEAHRAVTMAKAWAGDGFYRLGATAIQVFGGIGFTWEHDIGLYYKRLLTLQHSWGTTSDHLESLASQIL